MIRQAEPCYYQFSRPANLSFPYQINATIQKVITGITNISRLTGHENRTQFTQLYMEISTIDETWNVSSMTGLSDNQNLCQLYLQLQNETPTHLCSCIIDTVCCHRLINYDVSVQVLLLLEKCGDAFFCERFVVKGWEFLAPFSIHI